MALEIKCIPNLTGKSAKKFMKQSRLNEVSKKHVDFSEEVAKANKILEKAKFKMEGEIRNRLSVGGIFYPVIFYGITDDEYFNKFLKEGCKNVC